MEINICVLYAGSALSSGVFPARNHVLFQITKSRKIPPPARFISAGAVFHRKGARHQDHMPFLIKPG
ncbi:MAG: hypothetical protein B7X86_02790 [Sphingobacteriales bacterium 17-39-43]|nr:MAG: hypothetical protein B7Y76_07830 [Sphingobacteriia bacterium 35-40-5]OYZ33260.1 MAG: hypothetical protein B7Y24_02790 [Sphingobacteriales bacterium 16-39-50]OYZ51728.1 MAG: hypothetical protein B7Y19_05970 [Sphingobacteriales bacterium 24-40-4]OZA26669.1 MAG: hypothetical protein B7X86_02790 [Sphingobacteriales bacterium 17-39-43]